MRRILVSTRFIQFVQILKVRIVNTQKQENTSSIKILKIVVVSVDTQKSIVATVETWYWPIHSQPGGWARTFINLMVL